MRSAPPVIVLAVLVAATACTSSGTAQVSQSTAGTSVSATPPSAAATSTKTATASSPVVAASSAAPPLTGRIVFRRYGDKERTSASLFVINADGTHERALTRLRPAVLDYESNWSPDGKSVIFTRSTGSADGVNEARQLVTIAGSGGKETAVTPRRPAPADTIPGWDEGADFSPDGLHITYVHSWGNRDPVGHSDIYVADANGKNPRRVTHFGNLSGSSSGPRWSPDGKQIVFDRASNDPKDPFGAQALYLVNTDGTHLHRLTPWSAMAGGDPDWSKTANLIAFRSAPEESGIGNFFTIKPDGSGLHQVTHLSNNVISHQVSFSPDGRWLVFSNDNGNGTNQLTVAAVDGSRVWSLAKTKLGGSSPDWAGADSTASGAAPSSAPSASGTAVFHSSGFAAPFTVSLSPLLKPAPSEQTASFVWWERTATTTGNSLDGSLGCPTVGADQADGCYGIPPDYALRIAVLTAGGKPLLAWARTSLSTPNQAFLHSFDDMHTLQLS